MKVRFFSYSFLDFWTQQRLDIPFIIIPIVFFFTFLFLIMTYYFITASWLIAMFLSLITNLLLMPIFSLFSKYKFPHDESSPLTFSAFEKFYALSPEKFKLNMKVLDYQIIFNGKELLYFKTELDAVKAVYYLTIIENRRKIQAKNIGDFQKYSSFCQAMQEEINRVEEEAENARKKVEDDLRTRVESLLSEPTSPTQFELDFPTLEAKKSTQTTSTSP